MAVSGKKSKQRYRGRDAVDGNLARKLNSRELERRLETSGELDFDRQYRRTRETAAERRSRQRAQAKASVRPAQSVSLLAVIGFVAVAVLMVGLLMCYARLNAISRNIVTMKNQIAQLETEQVTLMTRYEQSFELTTVKEIAEAAGMTQPSESQIYYIDLPGADQAVSYSDAAPPGLGGIFTDVGDWLRRVLAYFG